MSISLQFFLLHLVSVCSVLTVHGMKVCGVRIYILYITRQMMIILGASLSEAGLICSRVFWAHDHMSKESWKGWHQEREAEIVKM